MNEHIAGEQLAAYVDGVLKSEEKTGLESHLSHCPECLQSLAEIVEIQRSRTKAPAEFLRRALGENESRVQAVMPLRLVFGVAAVFLVVVLIGYFFLGHSRSWQTGTVPADGSRRIAFKEVSPKSEQAEADIPAPVPQAAPAMAAETGKAPAAKGGKAGPAQALPPEKNVEPASVVLGEEQSRLADEAVMERRQEPEQVVGKVQAEPEKDKSYEMKMTASRTAASPPRVEEFRADKRNMFRSRSVGPAAAAGAAQIFLAATGRAVAPLAIDISSLNPRSLFRIEGDAVMADLRNPGLLGEWEWFPAGMSLELTIDADGAVTAVIPVGRWDRQTAAKASEAARKLMFSTSKKRSRRAVLLQPEDSIN